MKSIEIYNNLQEYISEFHDWCEGKTKSETHSFKDAWGLPNDSEVDGLIDEKNPPKSIPLYVRFDCIGGKIFTLFVSFASDNESLLYYKIEKDEFSMLVKNFERLG